MEAQPRRKSPNNRTIWCAPDPISPPIANLWWPPFSQPTCIQKNWKDKHCFSPSVSCVSEHVSLLNIHLELSLVLLYLPLKFSLSKHTYMPLCIVRPMDRRANWKPPHEGWHCKSVWNIIFPGLLSVSYSVGKCPTILSLEAIKRYDCLGKF